MIPNFLKNSPFLNATPFRPCHGYNINQTASLTTFGFPAPSAGELKIESVDQMGHRKRSCFPASISWDIGVARARDKGVQRAYGAR